MRPLVTLLLLASGPGLAATLTRGPYLQLADSTGITVVFRTDVPSVGTVRFGSLPGLLDRSASELVPSLEHTLRLSGLTPSTLHGYEVVVDGVTLAGGEAFRFRTHPAPGSPAPFRLFAWGDSGNGTRGQLEVAERLATEAGDATLSLILGDIIYDVGAASHYDDRYFAPYAPLLRRMVVWPTIGNHDVGLDPLGGPYIDAFVLPTNNPQSTELYYSFDYGDAHFVCLDTHVTGHGANSAQLQWAAADLAASTARWKFVFFHVPPWTGGTHSDSASVIAGIVPMVEAAGVDVVFSGHSHVYERTYLLSGSAIVQADPSSYVKPSPDAGTLYVVSGTAGQSGALANPTHPLMAFQAGNVLGASVIDVSGDTLHGYFLRQDGVAVDLFRLTKGADTSPPRLIAARALSPTEVELSFDEPVLAGSAPGQAERIAAYAITPVASLNGVEISRQNVLAAQDSAAVASASRERGLLEHRLVAAPPAAILVNGDNVLAIEVHNVSSTSSDLYLAASLRAVLDDVVDAGIDAGVDAGLAEGDAGVADAGADGAGIDAGVDAGSIEVDAGASDAGEELPDAGSEPGSIVGSCGCSVPGADGALLLFVLLSLRRRRG